MKKSTKFAAALLLTTAGIAAHAQAIQKMAQTYQDAPTLPIAAKPSAPAPAPAAIAAGSMKLVPLNWEVSSADGTLRKVISKWAATAGWTFGPEHWAASRDLPVSAGGIFTGDFRAAVRGLLSTSELTDLPLQPCFYTNSVLRVVPRAEICDRMAATDK